MKVTRLPVDPGPTGWNAILPPPRSVEVLDREITADFLVIGAGFAGLAAARRLAQLQEGARIVLLEASRVGEGPAGRNSGFMIDLPHDLSSGAYGGEEAADRAQIGLNRAGISFAAEAAREYGLGPEIYNPCGKTNAAATARGEAHNRAYARHLAALGEDCAWRDAGEMREMTGTAYYRSGLYTPGCSVIQPAAFVRGVAAGLVSNRVQVFEQSPVVALERRENWVATTPAGSVEAPQVVLAVNGHLNSFGFMAGRLAHVFTYASMTRVLEATEEATLGGAPYWGVTSADPMGSTVRKIATPEGPRLVIRNRFTFDPEMEVEEARIASVSGDHDRALAARFPQLAGIEMEFRWGGRLCLSRNNVQVVQELEDGLYAACCQNGLGTAKGTIAGKLAAEMACGVESPELEVMRAQAEPKRLPPLPIARLGAAAQIRWQEWRAGAEK